MMDDDDHVTGLELPGQSSPQHEEYQYDVLNANEIFENMVSSIKEVNSVVQSNTTITRILLNHFQWDQEKLYERLFDGSRDSLFKEAKIIGPELLQLAQSNSSISDRTMIRSRQQHQTCRICYLDISLLTGLGCGHFFCSDCWDLYLSTKIVEEGQSGSITCAALNCNILVDDQTVLTIVTDPRVKQRYQQLITNSYVECNKRMRWCPEPECGHAIKVAYPEFQPVECVCGTEFCFLCGHSWPEPVKCNLIRKWKKKCNDDSETSRWIAAHTKECPKCHATFEKNGGCNHMICENTKCKAEFCWVCLGPWQNHCSSSCNIYRRSYARAARDAQEKSRASLQRHLFYWKRYVNHRTSLRFENMLYESIKEKIMLYMQQHNISWIELQFLNRAVDVLRQCRQTLVYTYVFAYHQAKTNQTMIFEDNQKDLENATETLSEYLSERYLNLVRSVADIRDLRQNVQDKSSYCASRRKILLKHVQEGYEQGWWVMADN